LLSLHHPYFDRKTNMKAALKHFDNLSIHQQTIQTHKKEQNHFIYQSLIFLLQDLKPFEIDNFDRKLMRLYNFLRIPTI